MIRNMCIVFLYACVFYFSTTVSPHIFTAVADASTDCLGANRPQHTIEWQNSTPDTPVIIEWGFGNQTCNSVSTCFGGAVSVAEDDVRLGPQMPPLQLHQNTAVRFIASKTMGITFAMRVVKVNDEGFKNCATQSESSVTQNFTQEEIFIPQDLLQKGSNYFIAETNSPVFQCQFGLRINLTVKASNCHQGDPQVAPLCGNRGLCLSSFYQSQFECSCCSGYTGDYCSQTDACLSNPCDNNGTCVTTQDDTGYQCFCPIGYFGEACENVVENLCVLNNCENNGSCVGNQSDYTCVCPEGYEGHHCEVDINDCAAQPCDHGICVDRPNGHQCYCVPGYTGPKCDIALARCADNHCHNDGVCVESERGPTCHCTAGYTGSDCLVKVELCNPSPCMYALECVESEHDFYCTCKPGYAGKHCEIDINECASDPCLHEGNCVDQVSSFRCICPPGTHGRICQYVDRPMEEGLEGVPFDNPWNNRTPLKSLVLVTGTLGAAVLVALCVLLGCYCKVHGTYRPFLGWRRAHSLGYVRHKDEQPGRPQEACISLNEATPSVSAISENTAILEASTSREFDPVRATLQAKRI